MTPWQTAGVVVRTRYLDRGTAAFLKAHPRATVVHLACGLDCRAQRLEWGGETRWIDVDLPEVVALRRKVLPTTLPGRDYRLIAGDVTQEAWLDEIPVDRPTVVVMEGLLGYLEEADGRDLLFRLVERFKQGELLFECFGPAVVRSGGPGVIKKLGARLRWGVGDPKALADIHPRLEMLEAVPFVMAPGIEEMPWLERLTMYLISWVPRVRESILLVRLGIGRETGTNA
jgi:O-methyltransferase involved in polyketide biosynthesis